MALIHEFKLFDSEKNIDYPAEDKIGVVELDDVFVLYINDTLEWLPAYWENLTTLKTGINYYGTTIFDLSGTIHFSKIISSWYCLIENAPEIFELSTEFSIEDERFTKTSIKKDHLMTQLQNLTTLCEQAIKNDMLLVHFGI